MLDEIIGLTGRVGRRVTNAFSNGKPPAPENPDKDTKPVGGDGTPDAEGGSKEVKLPSPPPVPEVMPEEEAIKAAKKPSDSSKKSSKKSPKQD